MIQQHVCLIVLWLLFCVLHSLLAATWWKLRMSKLLGRSFRFYRFYYSIFATFNLIFLLYFLVTMQSPQIFELSLFGKLAASISGIAGIVIMLLCVRKYFSVVTGIKAFSAEKNSTAVLQRDGLHSYTRHPLYFGTLLFIWNLFAWFPLMSNLISCGMISIYTIAGIHIEERKLLAEFGDAYRSYSRNVPMLIPGIFIRRSKLRQSFSETA